MKSVTLHAAILASTVSALPQFKAADPNPWQAQGPGDVRAPCPGISTLANHGYINRNGKGITVDALQAGFLAAFGVAYDVTAPGAQNTINLCTSQQPQGAAPCTMFDIDILDTPHAVEHDGSMRTQDKGMYGGQGNNEVYNASIMQETKDIWGSATHINYQLSETTRQRRNEQQMLVDDPGWFQENKGGALTEQAFTLSTMSDPESDPAEGNARVDWVVYWYQNTRLPTEIGWTKPTTTISQTQIASITNACQTQSTIPPTITTEPAAPTTTEPAAPTTTEQPAQTTAEPPAKTTAAASPPATQTPFPYNPYQDIISPEAFKQLLGGVEDVVGGLVGGLAGGVGDVVHLIA